MSNALIGWPNYADVGALYTPAFDASGDWSTTLPLTNLLDRRLAKVARSATAAIADTRFRLDLGVDRYVKLIAVPKHTISRAGKYRVLGVPSTLLFDYEAGDDVAALGGTFARTGEARYVDSAGVLRTAATGVPRDGHFIDGVRTLLLEGARTNGWDRSEELDHANWIKGDATVSANTTAAPDGTTTADFLDEGGVNTFHYFQRNTPALTDNTRSVVTIHCRQSTGSRWFRIITVDKSSTPRSTWFNPGTGAIGTTDAGHVTFVKQFNSVHGNFWRFGVSFDAASGASTPYIQVLLATGDAVGAYQGVPGAGLYFWGMQFEADRPFPSSYIKTVAATATRNADSLSFPYTPVPQALSVYVKAYSLQPSSFDGSFVYAIGTAAGTRLTLHKTSGAATVTGTHRSAAGTVTSVPAAVVTYGQLVEYRTVLASTGAITQADSVASAAETVGAASAANTLDGAWAATTLYLNSDATPANVGFNAFASVRIALAAPTLAALQALVYDSGWLDAWPAVYPAGSLPSTDPRLTDGLYTAEEALGFPMGFVVLPSSPFTMRYVSLQVDDTANAAGYVDLARLMVCGGFQPTINMSYGLKLGWEDDSIRSVTDGGAAIHNVKSRRRTLTAVLRQILEDEALVSPYELMRRMGTSTQLFFVYDPADTYHLMRRSFLCTLRELSALEVVVGPRDGWPFMLIEEL